jgi:3-methyladenine DNA glycosylase/8-oxoguanine DNA glycosylase
VRAIIGQQISTRAAASIDGRLKELCGGAYVADRLLALGQTGIRDAGISGMKASYLLNLSNAVASGELPLDRLARLSDAEIVERLTRIKGIGVWTAEMFLIFALGRPDVLPVADLGVRVGMRRFHGLGGLPTPADCVTLAHQWRPYRSVAIWYLWRSQDAGHLRDPDGSASAST